MMSMNGDYILGADWYDDNFGGATCLMNNGFVVDCKAFAKKEDYDFYLQKLRDMYNVTPIEECISPPKKNKYRNYAEIPHISSIFTPEKIKEYFTQANEGKRDLFNALDWNLIEEMKKFAEKDGE